MFDPGRLRHRGRFESKVYPTDSHGDPLRGEQGELLDPVWTLVVRTWVAIEPLSVREFIQSAAMQSEVNTRIVARFREGLTAAMRFVHEKRGVDYAFYDLHGVLPDAESGEEYITLAASRGVNEGG
jgi:SPP1 family predicted phage head-tail adaptor